MIHRIKYGITLFSGLLLLYMSGCVSVSKTSLDSPAGMVLIPGGTNSGTNPLADEESDSDWYPEIYSLTVKSFYMDKYEITKEMWEEVYIWAIANGYIFDNAGSGKGTNHPVHTVNWYDVVKWCNARSEKQGLPAVYMVAGVIYRFGISDYVAQTTAVGYRLPTSEEWEYAARGGMQGLRFPWGNSIDHSMANYVAVVNGCSYDASQYADNESFFYHPAHNDGAMPYTSPVDYFPANEYGLHNTVGNVAEWTFDYHPWGGGRYRIVRGGVWNVSAHGCKVGSRYPQVSDHSDCMVGFRTVMPTHEADPLLTVVSGSGSGSYAAGMTVVVTANTYADPTRQRFSHWHVYPSDVYLGDKFSASSASTTVLMPAHTVTLTAISRSSRVIHGQRE